MRRTLLLSFPAAALVVSVTNGLHGLVVVNPHLETGGSSVELGYEFGMGFYAIAGLSYLVAVTYVSLLVRKFRRSRNVYRKLSFVILLTIFVISVAALLSITRTSPLPHFLLAPITYLVVGAVLILGTSSARLAQRLPMDRVLAPIRSRMDSTVPLARDFVMQEVDNGIIVLDADDRVVDINATAKRMLGLERPVGQHITEFTRPDLVLEGETLLPVLRGTEPVRELHDEIWVQTPDGDRCYDVTFSALADDGDAEETAHVVLMHDITDQKAREEQLRRQTEALETQTAQLEHQNERLDEFAGIVSHDLRNPLSIANGRVELMLATAGGDEQVTVLREDLEEVQEAHERMEAIIEDALTLARQGKAITETSRVDLATVARRAWENVDTAAAHLETECDSTVEADRDRLLTVFENLFRNAIEHGGEDVRVTVGDLADGFYVADDGNGIPEPEREEVLEHGYTTSAEGTGFGLAIVTDIANAHGWQVSVTESEDGGARFEITGVDRSETPTLEG
jgi:PAS domain S-box-containing protein